MAETTATTKALTIAQPWATLVAIGAKQIETRSWQTNYRGDIAIHAGKGLVASGGRSGLIELCNTMHFRQALYKDGFITHGHCDFDALPTAKMEFGSIIAIAELHDIRPTTEIADSISQQELAFGDYSPGRFAWLLRNVRVLGAPIRAKGALGLWNATLYIGDSFNATA